MRWAVVEKNREGSTRTIAMEKPIWLRRIDVASWQFGPQLISQATYPSGLIRRQYHVAHSLLD